MQPAALLPADAAHGLFIDRTITFVWIAWDGALSAQPLINGNGNNLVAFSGTDLRGHDHDLYAGRCLHAQVGRGRLGSAVSPRKRALVDSKVRS